MHLPRSPHLLVTGSKLKYSLLHVLPINGALPRLLYPPFQVLNVPYTMAYPFLCILQLFFYSRGKNSRSKHQVDYYGEDVGGHSSFPMNFDEKLNKEKLSLQQLAKTCEMIEELTDRKKCLAKRCKQQMINL